MNRDEYNRYLNGLPPAAIAEHLKDILPELGDLDVEEVLLQQESAFLYIENNRQHNVTFDYGQPSKRSVFFEPESESPYAASIESQLALDEALARALEMEDGFNDLHISEPRTGSIGSDSDTDNTGSNFTETHVTGEGQNTRQDDIDPDRMTYEELQSLGESVGHESQGLPTELISRLPTSKYKAGSSSKKNEKEQCVICCVEYKNGVKVTTLPCAHHYHSDCINKWLQLKKHCPVCQNEVQDE